ncbi:MAG: glucosamine-6-phosphate deaminase [Deltaproteobacteria bacterium]|nr:glucosamine-6-phosphate deaminase [Deltaproteobacteria bacterium]
MEVLIVPDAAAAGARGARIIAALLRDTPAAVLGLATGETQRPLYVELVRRVHAHELRLAAATTFNLDEFVGVAADHPGSFRRAMRQQLFELVDVDPTRVHFPAAASVDEVPEVCARYEAAIEAAGGIDLQLLGIGEDGHIGFNEPTSSLSSRTRLKTLTQRTIDGARAVFSPGEPPRHVVTMGIATILSARRCLLLATGARKARAVAAMVEGPLTAMVPASALQLHARATVIVDEAAAAQLALAAYYRDVERCKPAWQRRADGDDEQAAAVPSALPAPSEP